MTPTIPPSPAVGDVITTAGGLDGLREAVAGTLALAYGDDPDLAFVSDHDEATADAVLALVAQLRPDAPPVAPTAGVDREALVNALRPVLCNASSYPREVQPRILGRDMGPLLAAAADAVLAFLADQPTPAPVGAAAVERPAHGPDWSDWDFDHPEEWPSCRCGFNGSPEECAAARAGEVQR